MTILALEKNLNDLKKVDPRKAAEIAYALAKLHLDNNDIDKATYFGRESIQLFDKCKMETLEDCAAQHNALNGVVIPEIIHQDVVRDRLKTLKL